jgi:hypothetical protein
MNKKYEQHEIGQCWPPLSEEEFSNLKATAHDNPGEKPPVILYEGKILDGWHWYKACQELQIAPRFEQFNGDQDPTDFVANRHKGRRHLSRHDAAEVASKLAPLHKGGQFGNLNPKKDVSKTNAPSDAFVLPTQTEAVTKSKHAKGTLESVTESVGTNPTSVQKYRYIQAHGIAQVIEAAKTNKITLNKAAALAHLPKDEQLRALKEQLKPKKSRIRSRRKTPRRSLGNLFHPQPEPRSDIRLVQDAWEEWLSRWLYDLADDLHLTVLIYMKEKLDRALEVYHEARSCGELVGLTRESDEKDKERIKEIMKQVEMKNEAV